MVDLPVGVLKLASLIVLSVFVVWILPVVTEVEIPGWVWRRLCNDHYNYSNSLTNESAELVCGDVKNISITYLVSERQCVKNQELFDGIYNQAKIPKFNFTDD